MKYLFLTILFLVPSLSYGAFGDVLNTDVDSCTVGGGGTCNITIPSTTSGSLLTAWGRGQGGGWTAVSDATNGSWTTDLDIDACGEFANRNCTFAHFGNSGGSITTITITGEVFSSMYVTYVEFDAVTTLDANATAMGSYGSPWTSNSVTPTASIDALLVGAAYSNEVSITYTGSDSYTTRVSGNMDAGSAAQESKVVSGTSGSYTASGTVSAGGAHGALLIFKGAAGGAATVPHIFFRGQTIIRGQTIFR